MHDGPVVVVTGGGTGGHLYPALAIADALRAERPDVRVLFVGAARGLEARVLPARNEWHVLLPIRGADRGGALSTALAATRVVPDIALAWRELPAGLSRIVLSFFSTSTTGGRRRISVPSGPLTEISPEPIVTSTFSGS